MEPVLQKCILGHILSLFFLKTHFNTSNIIGPIFAEMVSFYFQVLRIKHCTVSSSICMLHVLSTPSFLNLMFMGPCILSIFWYISHKMQSYPIYFFLEIALRVLGGIATYHQEHIQLYLQHLTLVKLSQATCRSYGLTSARCCRYSYMCYWWLAEIPPEICRAISITK